MASEPIESLARQLLGKELATLEPEEHRVLSHIHRRIPVSQDSADTADDLATFGERMADKVAAIGGSWAFIASFTVVLLGWMLLNTDILSRWDMAFDPFPYIFLNLMLSTLAAIQAPVILMSQNRQAARDRVASSLDFEVNLRAELEILQLHEKIDSAVAARLDSLAERQEQLLALFEYGSGARLQP